MDSATILSPAELINPEKTAQIILATALKLRYEFSTAGYIDGVIFPTIRVQSLQEYINDTGESVFPVIYISLFDSRDNFERNDYIIKEKSFKIVFSASCRETIFLLDFLCHFFSIAPIEYILENSQGAIISVDDMARYIKEKNYNWLWLE